MMTALLAPAALNFRSFCWTPEYWLAEEFHHCRDGSRVQAVDTSFVALGRVPNVNVNKGHCHAVLRTRRSGGIPWPEVRKENIPGSCAI